MVFVGGGLEPPDCHSRVSRIQQKPSRFEIRFGLDGRVIGFRNHGLFEPFQSPFRVPFRAEPFEQAASQKEHRPSISVFRGFPEPRNGPPPVVVQRGLVAEFLAQPALRFRIAAVGRFAKQFLRPFLLRRIRIPFREDSVGFYPHRGRNACVDGSTQPR